MAGEAGTPVKVRYFDAAAVDCSWVTCNVHDHCISSTQARALYQLQCPLVMSVIAGAISAAAVSERLISKWLDASRMLVVCNA